MPPGATFRTTDAKVATIATAAGGKLLELDTSNPRRVVFVFGGDVGADFDLRIRRGLVRLDARDVVTAMGVVDGLLRDRRRGR